MPELEVSWRLDHAVPCGNPACDRKVLPHEVYVQLREIFIHEACVPKLEVKRRARAEPCAAGHVPERGTDLFVTVRGGGRFPLCPICFEDLGGTVPSEDVFEDGHVRVQQAEHDDSTVDQVRAAMRVFLELMEESGAMTVEIVRKYGRDPAIPRAHSDMLRESREVLKRAVPVTLDMLEEHELRSDAYDFLAQVAQAEILGKNPLCSTKFKHVTFLHAAPKTKHHTRRPRRCHDPSCYRCWRSDARDILRRHTRTIDVLLEKKSLYVLEIPWEPSLWGNTLADRLESVLRGVRRRVRKVGLLAWARVDAAVVLVDRELELGRFYAKPAATWDELERAWVPIVPFNMLFTDPDAPIAYGGHGRRRVRSTGAFFKNARPRTRTVATKDPKTGVVRKERKPICPVCGEPAESVKVVVLDEGQYCVDCPERSEPGHGPIDRWTDGLGRRRPP